MTASSSTIAGLHLLVTGGTGFVGSAFVRKAVRQGARVTVVARPSADHWRLRLVAGRYGQITASLAQLDAVDPGPVGTPDVMVHFAAAGVNQHFDDVGELVATNVDGTVRALRCAQRLGVSRFVLVGSSGEYGPGERISESAPLRPTAEYGASRAAATLLARAFGERRGLDVVVVRPFAVYGPYEGTHRLMPYCIVRALAGMPLKLSSGEQIRDYVHVDDVARGIARACVAESARGGIFNLCTGVGTAVREAAALVVRLTGARAAIELGGRAPIPGEMWRTSGDPTLAEVTLAWKPRSSLTEGLVSTIAWFQDLGLSLPFYREMLETP